MDIAAEPTKTSASEKKDATRLIPIRGLTEILEQHGDWLESDGETGIPADFSRENLEGADLIDARLQDAILNKAILRRADLMLADLRGASLLQANLRDANLLGTMFQQANLQAATLEGATGLHNTQLAGANLFGAVLPVGLSPSEGLKQVREVAARAGWFLFLIFILNAVTWLRIFTTRDAQLLRNAPALPYFGLQADVPYIPFFLFGPVVILSIYICFHLYLQRLWDGAAQLPAIFLDGRTLDTCLPWFARWSARRHFKWLRRTRSPLAFLEEWIARVLLYWIAPATLLLFWGRYLTLEDLRGTTLHLLLVAGAIAAAMNFPRMVGKAFGADSLRPTNERKSSGRKNARLRIIVPFGAGLFLLLLSIGIVVGAPHGAPLIPDSGPDSGDSRTRTWAADILWAVGYNPYAQLTETDVSIKPSIWSEPASPEKTDEEIVLVKGATLNRLKLRYAQAYGAFFVKARLWQADLRNAYLAEADLRETNLREADLRFAILDRAKLAGASLQNADLRNANLNRADLQQTNLSSAMLPGATLLDATLDGANLYKADLRFASLQRASLKQADLREANFENANLTMANLQEAYLTSTKLAGARLNQADLSLAFLTDADLRKSDLSGGDFRGAILRDANLSGANLQGANLRGAVGLTANQICSAVNFAQIQLDENVQGDVQALCGNRR